MNPVPLSNGHDPESTPAAPSAVSRTSTDRRCRGKIARLPKTLRDLVNHMLDDGLPYSLIKNKLEASTDPPLPFPITEKDISRWYAKGYQRYLSHQDHLDFLHGNREDALDMVANDDTTTLPEATLQIIANQYFDLLGDFSPDALKQQLSEDPLKYTRFLNVFARLVREIVHLKKYRELAAKNAAAVLPEKDLGRDVPDNELGVLMNHMDRVFKMRRPRNPAPACMTPQAPPSSGPAHPTSSLSSSSSAPSIENGKSKIENSQVPKKVSVNDNVVFCIHKT